ncbi:hypothetical protein PybrP1_010078 [[Pythium] brassicae (nom. inval.)]|nr:hypothetical protein PybrP1_010078 [[Pythium] brassicae (nom. inval.)]
MELMETAPANAPGGPYQPLPTSDGGGKKGDSSNSSHQFSIGRNSQQPEDETASDDVDVTHASGGIEWLKISRDELLKLRSIRVPVKELHYLFMCIVILLEKPPKQARKAKPTPKQLEEFTPANFSWMRCREILHQSFYWSECLRDLHVASVKIYSWLQRLLDEYDEKELGLRDQGPHETLTIPPEILAPASSTPPKSSSPTQPRQKLLQPRPPTMPPHSHEREEQQLAKEFASHGSKVKIVDKGRLFNHASR